MRRYTHAMRYLGVLVLLGALSLTGCAGETRPTTPEQYDCETADDFLPTLIDAQAGELSESELRQAESDLTELINENLIESGQVSAMIYVLGAPVWSDSDGLDRTERTFDDFHGQLIEYCEEFADWEMKN